MDTIKKGRPMANQKDRPSNGKPLKGKPDKKLIDRIDRKTAAKMAKKKGRGA